MDDDLNDALKVIRDNFVVSLAGRRNQLENAMLSWQHNQFVNQDPAMQNLYSLSHQLTGTAGSIGFQEISAAARDMNTRLRLLLQSEQQHIDDAQLSAVMTCFSQLQFDVNNALGDTT